MNNVLYELNEHTNGTYIKTVDNNILQDALILELKPLVSLSSIENIFQIPNPNYPNAFLLKKDKVYMIWLIIDKIDLTYSNMLQFLECLLEALFVSTEISPALFYKIKYQPVDKIKLLKTDTVNILSGRSYSINDILTTIENNPRSNSFSFYLKKFWQNYEDYQNFLQLTEGKIYPSQLKMFKQFPELKNEYEKKLPPDLLERKEADQNLAFLLNVHGVSTENIIYLLTEKAFKEKVGFSKNALRQYYIALLQSMGLMETKEDFNFKQVIKAREIIREILGVDVVYIEIPPSSKEKIKVVMADGTQIPIASLKEFTVPSTYTTLMVAYKKETFGSVKSHKVKNNMQILMGAVNALLVRRHTNIFENDLILYLQEYITNRTTYCYPVDIKLLKDNLSSITTPVILSNTIYTLITKASEKTRKEEFRLRRAFIAKEAIIAINIIDLLKYLRENYSKIIPLNEAKKIILSLPGALEKITLLDKPLYIPGILFLHSYSLNITNALFKENGIVENLIPYE